MLLELGAQFFPVSVTRRERNVFCEQVVDSADDCTDAQIFCRRVVEGVVSDDHQAFQRDINSPQFRAPAKMFINKMTTIHMYKNGQVVDFLAINLSTIMTEITIDYIYSQRPKTKRSDFRQCRKPNHQAFGYQTFGFRYSDEFEHPTVNI